MKRSLIVGVALLLSACGTARTIVMDPVKTSTRYARAELVENNPNVKVPAEVTQTFRSAVEKGLYEKGAFNRGQDLRVVYTFVSHNPGSQFERWFWGGIGNAGEGSVAVNVVYMDANGTELGKTQVEGRIGSGMFGGSYDEALHKAAEEVVKFTIDNFGTKR